MLKIDLKTVKDYFEVADHLMMDGLDKHHEVIRYLLRTDLFFLLWFGCGRRDMEHQWLLDRCQEVETNPDGYLDLWSRDHYKSTIITYGKTIQDILASHGENPLPEWRGLEPSIAIFSHTKPIARGFLRQIKRELEQNQKLKHYFPDVIWENPDKDAPKWSESDGLILKRKSNAKEATLEAWGVVEGQPISKHFDRIVYDDLVTLDSVRTPDMMRKTMESWEMSINLLAGNGAIRMIGTRYHMNDAYREIMKRGVLKPRVYPGIAEGKLDVLEGKLRGTPVLKSMEWMQARLEAVGSYTFSTQILQNPVADESQTLKKEWIRYYEGNHPGSGCNKYLLCDPAGEKKRSSDYTVMMVIGLAQDGNYRLLDMIRDRLNLRERADQYLALHREWQPMRSGYEKYGMQADIEYLKERMRQENYYFDIIPLGGQIPKPDRIKRLVPSLEGGKWYFPQSLLKTDYQGKTQDLVDIYLNEEFLSFPVCVHDDMLDCQSRIMDKELNTIWPRMAQNGRKTDRYRNGSGRGKRHGASVWAS